MARKPHKLAHNGLELETSLSQTDLRKICLLAASESTGDLWNGKHKIVESGSGEGWISFLTKDALIGWSKLMTFAVAMDTVNARTTLETEIKTYVTTQSTVYGIPAGPKKMAAHHSYMQFVHKVANTVRESDPSARVTITEGAVGVTPTAYASATVPAAAASVASPVTVSEELESAIPAAAMALAVAEVPSMSGAGQTLSTADEPAPLEERTTKVERRRRVVSWQITPDGLPARTFVNPLVVGRDPIADAGGDGLRVPRSETSVSKTHARFELINGAVHVIDLDSTNGTFIVDPHDDMVQCEPNVPTQVPAGYAVELGAYSLLIDSAAVGHS